MKRLLRLRLSLLLIGLAAVPIAALPFAKQIRDEWKRYREPKPAVAGTDSVWIECDVGVDPICGMGSVYDDFASIERFHGDDSSSDIGLVTIDFAPEATVIDLRGDERQAEDIIAIIRERVSATPRVDAAKPESSER